MPTFEESQYKKKFHFTSPHEEIEYLRAQIAEKERVLRERSNALERESTIHNEIQKYKELPVHDTLHPSMQLSHSEIDLIVQELHLPPDQDNKTIENLLGILQENGIKNSLTVAERLQNPHIEDDFHRALVQYIAHGYTAPDLSKQSSHWNILSMVLFEITLPEPSKEEKERPLKELISVMEHFYHGMFSIDDESQKNIYRYFSIEIAVSAQREDISFFMAVPHDKEDLFEKQLQSIFPRARAHHVPEDYNIFVHDGNIATSYATYADDPILPLKDYREFDHDPLSVLINTLTKINPVGEGAAVQFIINPIGGKYVSRYKKVLEKVEKGTSLKKALKDTPNSISGEVTKTLRELFSSTSQKKEEPAHIDSTIVDQIRKKIETPIPDVCIRLVASAQTQHRADAILSDIESSFNQLQNTAGNKLVFKRALQKNALGLAKQFTFREYHKQQSLPMSLRELTTILHFPTHTIAATPQLRRSRAAEAPAPIGLPTSGTLLGTNTFRGIQTPALLTSEDRLRHLYVIGQTGTGKTVFMKNLIMQDIERGDGVCFIDPHGSDIEDVLSIIPEHRMRDVIYFDPSNTQHITGLNMLEYDPRFPNQKTFVINELFSIFKKLYSNSPESMGPAFEQYFRNATALVLEDPSTGCTLLDISRVLADERYREVKLMRSNNPIVNQFWRDIATKAQGEASLQNIVPYITNKFDIFTANDIMRPIIAQQRSSFRLREVMDTKKILLVNLSKGKLGAINANLLGMILVGKMLMAAMSRVDALASDLPPFYLYIDEFQNITTDSISAILSEARKYKLSLNIAHQFIAQLDENTRDAVFGNVGSLAVFRTGSEDAEYLENQFKPVFEAQDIMNIENRNAYLKILAHGVPQKPFSIKVPAPKHGSSERAQAVKLSSQEQYTRPIADIQKEINMRYAIT